MASLVAFFTINVAFGETFYVTNPDEFQNALTKAQSNGEDDVINVAAGTYNITSTLHYSTYDGDGGHKLTIQGAGADQTVLDGGGSVQILYINTDIDHDDDDSGGDITIRGITFENGYEDYCDGGGVYVDGSLINITIRECTFSENSAYHYYFLFGDGGGVYAGSYGTITITNNTFSGNSAEDYGGAVYAGGHTVIITNNTFSGNSADDGGAVCARGGTITITNNTFSGNSANCWGGGVDAWSIFDTIIIASNIFSKNSAGYGGGVHAGSDSGTITITNNTFSGNSASNDGGGVYAILCYFPETLNVYNNILFGNTANAGDDLYVSFDGNYIGSTVNLYNNNFSGNADFDTGHSEDLYITLTDNYHHAGNIQQDPQFVDPENGDFHLKPSSPCIDAGTADPPELPDSDFEGDPRIVGSAPDIGADEYYIGQLVPIPDIKINNSDGLITLYQNDTLTITVSLNNNGITNNADWWLAAVTPLFDVFFYIRDEGWTGAWVPGYQGPLFYLDSFEVLNMPVSGLPAGTYTLYFGVDTVMDGDVTWDSVYYDTVEVNITDYSYLLEKYAPVLKFCYLNEERYLPTRVEDMIEHSELRVHIVVPSERPDSTPVLDYWDTLTPVLDQGDFSEGITAKELSENSNITEAYFNLDDDYLLTWSASQCVVYGRVVPSGDYTYLQYWFFYVYNNWENEHEGDWEMITVELDKDMIPQRVGYSQHTKVPSIWKGGEVVPWEKVEENGHPVVYVAKGSHASYPTSGSTNVPYPLGDKVFWGIDWHPGNFAIEPSSSFYQLLRIDDEASRYWEWIKIDKLRWGKDSGWGGSPSSPVAQGDKWSDPGAWMDSLQ